MKLTDLKCEYAHNPLGLGVARPRLFWRLETSRAGARQIAYRVRVASSTNTNQSADLWDSGRIESDQTMHVVYEGLPLIARQRVFWNVEIEDETGAVTTSEIAWWEMGLLESGDWSGQWIGAHLAGGPRTTVPVPLLRRAFEVEKPVRSARLYATALGIYECSLNGQRVGDQELSPGWTDYAQRVQFQSYDVTAQIQPGENQWDALLGDGWYCGHVEWRGRQRYGTAPKFLGQLEIEYLDGSREIIATDGQWNYSLGPILEADFLMGQSHDARLEWDDWRAVQVFEAPNIEISAMIAPPVRAVEEIAPIFIRQTKPQPHAEHIFDFGQNMVGRVRLKARGARGKTVRLRFAETLQGGPAATDGPIYTTNLRSAAQTDYYTFKGEGEEVFEPKFTFHGFRFVEVVGLQGEATPETLTGVVLQSDNARIGDFSCSDPLVNQLQKNIDWGWRGNSVDVPTDCPQRDERLGWTGDAQVFVRTAAFNRDVSAFFTEWQRDIADAQTTAGGIPCVVPDTGILNPEDGVGAHAGASQDGGPAWADAVLICPWTIYRTSGDTRILEENYETFKRFFDYLQSTSRDGLRCFDEATYFKGFGDWLAVDGSGKTEGGTPKELIGTAFFAHSADLMSRIADVLGKTEDAARYRELFQTARAAWTKRFATAEGLVSPPYQTPYLLGLEFDLLPEEMRSQAAAQLVKDIRNRGTRLSTGFVGSPYLNHVLSATGHDNVAWELLHQTKWPSWLYAVTQGATTIWERWDGWTHDKGFQDVGMNSFNHYAYGAIGAWLYQWVAGIELDDSIDGYKRFKLQPHVGGKLTHAKAHLDTLHGRIESEWELDNGTFKYRFVVPPNTSAKVSLPDGSGFESVAGKYEGEVVLNNKEV